MSPFYNSAVVDVGGEKLTLVINIGAIDAIERKADMGFPALFEKIGSGDVRVGLMSALMWGLLRAKHPDKGMDEAGAIIIEHGDEIGPVIVDLVSAAFPQPKEGEGDEPNPRKRRGGTGKTS